MGSGFGILVYAWNQNANTSFQNITNNDLVLSYYRRSI